MSDDKPEKGFTVVDRRVGLEEESGGSESPADPSPVSEPAGGDAQGSSNARADASAAGSSAGPSPSGTASMPGPSASAPPVTFPAFILSLHASALINLGMIPGPGGQEPVVDLELARENIDLLEILRDKTKGNLSEDEGKLLNNILYELRMAYIQTCEASGREDCQP